MKMNFNFQPSGKCGNCYWFRRSEKKDNIVTKPCGCRKDNDPKECPSEDFMARNKKKAKKKHKSWELETKKSRKSEKRFDRK